MLQCSKLFTCIISIPAKPLIHLLDVKPRPRDLVISVYNHICQTLEALLLSLCGTASHGSVLNSEELAIFWTSMLLFF